MGNNSSSRSSSLSHTAVGGSSNRQRSFDSQVRERPALRSLSSGKNASAVTSAAAASSRVTASPPLTGNALPTRRQRRDAAAEAMTASAGTQDNHLVSPVSSARRHGLHSLSSLPPKSVEPLPARATAAAITASLHFLDGTGPPLRDSRERERSCDAELSPPQRHQQQQQQNNDFDFAVIDTPNSCQGHGDDENANGGAARSGSVVSVHRARSSSMLQAATDSAVPLPLTTLLSLEDAHPAPTNVSTAPAPADGHTRGTVSMRREGGTEVDMHEHNTNSSKVCRAVSPSALIPKGSEPLESPAFPCPPSTAASPLPVGQAALSTNVPCHPSTTTRSTTTPQRPDEPLNVDVEGIVNRGSRTSKSDLKSRPEGTGDGRSGGGGTGGFWRRQSRNILFRKLLSRSGSRADRSSLPPRPEAGEDGGGAGGTKVKFTAGEDSVYRRDIAAKIVYKRTSPAQRVHDVPSTASAALGTQPRSSASSPFPAGAAAATATGLAVSRSSSSSMTAQRVYEFQSPAAGGRPVGRTTVTPTVDDVRSFTSGSTSPRCAEDVSGPGPGEEEGGEALPRGFPASKGGPHSRQLVPGEQVAAQDSDESDLTTPTDTNSAPILPPPPTASFAEAVWGTRRAAASAIPKTATNNTSLFSVDDHANGRDSDGVAAAALPLSVYYSFHQQPRQLKAPGVLGAGLSSTTTVTDTTARVSPPSPFVSPLTAVAVAESSGSAAVAAFPSSAATADACLRGRRSVSQSAIIAAWNRMGARTGTSVSGVGVGEGHHGWGEGPEPSAEGLQMLSTPGKSLAVAGDSIGGGAELATSAVPASRDTQLGRVPTAAAAEVAIGEAPAFRLQCTVAGHQEAGNCGSSRRSCAGVASVLPIRRRSVAARQRGPPPLFSPSLENSTPSDGVPQPLSALGQLSIREDAPAAGHPASPPVPTKTENDITHSWASAPPQELHRPPRVRIKYKEEERSADRAPPLTRELSASLCTSTAASTAIATQWPSSPESRRSDASLSMTQSLQAGILVPVNVGDRRSGGALVEERERLSVRRTMAYDEEMGSATATTVGADEEDRVNEEDGAAERRAAPRTPQSLAQHQLQRQPFEAHPHRTSAPGFTTTHTTVAANSTAPGLLSAHSNDPHHYSPPQRMASGTFFAPSTSGAALCGAISWAHSSPSSQRSYNTSDSRLEAARGAQNVEDEDESIDEVGLRRTRDGEDAHCRLHRSEDDHAKCFVGLHVTPFSRNCSPPSVFASRSNSIGFNAMATATRGGGGKRRATLVRSNSYQPLSRCSQQEPTRNTSLLSSTARAMPRWRERLTPSPQPTSPLSLSVARDDVGRTASGLLSTPGGRRGLTSQGAPSLAHQPSAHLHHPPPPPNSALPSHGAQYLRREISGSLGSVRWQELSLHASGGQTSPNFDFAGSSRDNDNTPPRYDALGDDEEDLDAMVNEDNAEGGNDDGPQRRQGCPASDAVGEDTGDDGDDTFPSLESSEASMWGTGTLRTWHRDDDDGSEEEDNVYITESGAGSCSNGEVRSGDRHCLRLPQRHRWRRYMIPPSASTQFPTQQPQESYDVGGASRKLDPSTPSAQGIPPSRTGPRTFADAVVRLPQTRYEPPMPSNRNTFTAFVHLSDIASSQLLATAAAAATEDDGGAVRRAGPHVPTLATADTLILNAYALRGAHLADGAGVRADVVDVAGGVVPISPVNSSLSTAPTDRISRADTPAPVAVHGAVTRRTSQGAEAEAASTRSESPGALSRGAPPKVSVTKAPQGLNHAATAVAAAAVGLDGSNGGLDGDSGAGSDSLSVAAAQAGATSPRTSWSLESMKAGAVPVSEGEQHALSDEERLWLDAFGHSTPLLHGVADAAVAVDGHLPQSAPLSGSQSLPWWNRHRGTTRSEGSGTLDFSQRGGESGNGGGRHSPYSSLSVNSALAAVRGGCAASPASPPTPTGSVAMTGLPLGHTLHPGGGAVTSASFTRSGGRLRREAQYPTTPTNGCRSSTFRSSSGSTSSGSGGTNSNGGDAAHCAAAGAALRHRPNAEVLVMQGRSCDVSDIRSEKRVAGKEGIEGGAALVEKCTSHDHEGDNAGLRDVCMPTRKRHPWMPVFPSSPRSVTTALAAGTACAESDSSGVLAMTTPTHAMATITVVPPTLSFIEEAEVQSPCSASPLAPAIAAASGGPYRGEGELTSSDNEALDEGVDSDEGWEVDVPILLSRGVQAHHSRRPSGVSNTIAAPTNTALTAALDGLGETETYARTRIEVGAADARDAGVSVRDTLQTQHSSATAPFALPSLLSGMGMMESWASDAMDSAAGGAGPDSGSCSGAGTGTTCVAGGGRDVTSVPTARTTATFLAVLTSRESCDSLVSPSQTPELPLMPRHSGNATGGNGGTGSGPGSRLTDERVSGVEAADSSALTGAHDAEDGDAHDRRVATHADAGLEAEDELPHPPLATKLKGSHSMASPPGALHRCVDIRSAGSAVGADQRDTSLGGQITLTVPQYSPEPSQPTASCPGSPPGSPDHVSARSPLLLDEEASVGTCAASRAQTRPDHHYGLVLSPSPHHEGLTPHVRSQSRSQRQHRGPSVGQVVCHWCGEPYTSADVCLAARRPHSVLREERRIEKAAKRRAQTLLREGRVTEAVTLLKSAGVYVP
ncbi:hypothetical protein LMXM_21_0861 [Leishmania mexicana MHOM/GT/2001/U1103]|uniref:Uncharacterized protein n=1 Tax=Leishmania mexicana (strain MHOM/GT/2001/U1103) TaxID=929439 RepID=E9AV62_LEIMU|nr:hypothetical protein LMXM_21_0861 [Leishmania mexicana MHOM/GT/2001/U1103]CBZ26844.1 hypothetical protein LMXM_21_0861 [Leishmania mexicana MHOM/GT/2001/U1103]